MQKPMLLDEEPWILGVEYQAAELDLAIDLDLLRAVDKVPWHDALLLHQDAHGIRLLKFTFRTADETRKGAARVLAPDVAPGVALTLSYEFWNGLWFNTVPDLDSRCLSLIQEFRK